MLANIYLHHVLDQWWVKEVQPRLWGRSFLVRYADDFVMVCELEDDARRVEAVLPKRFGRFGLTLHPDKTRLLRFGRPGWNDRKGPGSFDFLGFTHLWARSRKGAWVIKQKTAKSRFSRAVKKIAEWCRVARHWPIAEQAKVLRWKLRGHYGYYGIAGNAKALSRFYEEVLRRWHKWLSRRSQRGFLEWEAFRRLLRGHPLPLPRLPARAGPRAASP